MNYHTKTTLHLFKYKTAQNVVKHTFTQSVLKTSTESYTIDMLPIKMNKFFFVYNFKEMNEIKTKIKNLF